MLISISTFDEYWQTARVLDQVDLAYRIASCNDEVNGSLPRDLHETFMKCRLTLNPNLPILFIWCFCLSVFLNIGKITHFCCQLTLLRVLSPFWSNRMLQSSYTKHVPRNQHMRNIKCFSFFKMEFILILSFFDKGLWLTLICIHDNHNRGRQILCPN